MKYFILSIYDEKKWVNECYEKKLQWNMPTKGKKKDYGMMNMRLKIEVLDVWKYKNYIYKFLKMEDVMFLIDFGIF